MQWPLSPPSTLLVVGYTVGAALWSAVNARRMRALAQSAALSGNPAAIAATQRRITRSWHRHRTYMLPSILVGMALLIAQATTNLARALPPH